MKVYIKNGQFDTSIESSDWQYSACIVGLIKYFKYFKKDGLEYEITRDMLLFNKSDITEDRYLEFAEYYYEENFHHIFIENRLHKETYTDEEIKLINEKLTANTIMKKVVGKNKFDGTNGQEFLELIDLNRNNIIKETFRNKNDMYKNFCNTNCLFTDQNDCCRLTGYYIDMNKKGKSNSYNFNKSNYVYDDIKEFDFIPFAFKGARETFFINDNIKIENLEKTASTYEGLVNQAKTDNERIDARKVLFKSIIEVENFIDTDIEVIVKRQDNDFFETMYIRKESIKILKKIKDYYDVFCFSVKVNDNYWINVQEEVVDSILNNLRVDKLIERFLKDKERDYTYVISRLIKLNILIVKGEDDMEQKTYKAVRCAEQVTKSNELTDNKLLSYRQKLISAIVLRDYDRVCEVLLQLSNYSRVSFDFAYDLFEDFEKNKDIAYSFINALTRVKKQDSKGGENNE